MKLTHLLVAVFSLLIVAGIYPLFIRAEIAATRPACLSNLKQLGMVMSIYNSDHGMLPPRDNWMDATLPYAKINDIYRCQRMPKGTWGYAFNAGLVGKNSDKVKAPETVPMIYDSLNSIRNASDLVTSLPPSGRHGDSNMICFVDGHARGFSAKGDAP